MRFPAVLGVVLSLLAGSINPANVSPTQAAGTWSPVGNMAANRYGHTATLLLSGKVLIAGGNSSSGNLASAELYNPANGTFSTTGSMATARGQHTATLLADGMVLVAGGYNGSYLAGAELYNPGTGTWSVLGSMAAARAYHTATVLPSGKILIAGGYGGTYLATAEIYDPSAGTFSSTGSLATARRWHTATALPSGKVLVAGGGGTGSTTLASAELYDPTPGTFSPTGTMTQGRIDHTETLLPSGKVLVASGTAGGSNYLTSAELYDPTPGTFSTTGGMAQGRIDHTATLLPSGKVIVAGGCCGFSASSVELYTPSAGTFSSDASMGVGRAGHTATRLPTGCVVITGGDGSSGFLANAELYKESPCATGPDLTVTKTGVVSGQTVTYTITVTNIGTVAAVHPVQVSDPLPSTPAGMQFTSMSSNCSGPLSGPIVCTDPNAPTPLGPGNSFTSTISLNAGASGGVVTNCATVSQGSNVATPADPDLTNNQACATNTVQASSTPGSISGHKWHDLNMNGIMDSGEPALANITICLFPTNSCVSTDSNGNYTFSSLPPGNYSVFEAFYPGWANTTPDSRQVTVAAGQALSGVNFGNGMVMPPPTEVQVTGGGSLTTNGVPLVFNNSIITITKDVALHCGGVSPVQIRLVLKFPVTQGEITQMMTNTSGSMWSATFPTLAPNHGITTLTFYVDCPPGTIAFPENLTDGDNNSLPDTMGPEDEIQVGGQIYVDPSGTVVNNATSAPITGATVTLLKESPSGSGVYSMPSTTDSIPSTNPQITGADGASGWVVVPGRWKVRATAPGCSTVDSAAMDIPPAVTDLTLRLTCQSGPSPVLTGPADNSMQGLGPLLQWTNPAGTTQYQVQVIPFNNDGPGINLIRNVETSFQVQAPIMGVGNYVMLPGMTYTWRVRTTQATTSVSENDPGWSAWVSRTFVTPLPSSTSIRLTEQAGGMTDSQMPTLQWDDTDTAHFYYEVQVSKDLSFNTDSATASAMVYWELRHGGVTTPRNSYTIPSNFPLERGATYHWRVRPRVQGDGVPVAWSAASSFKVADNESPRPLNR